MTALTSTERVMRALRCEEPDRVPHFEWLVDRSVRDVLCPGCKSHNEFAVKMGHDAVLTGPHFDNKQIGPDRWLSEWGFVFEYGREEHGVEIESESPIRTMRDLESYSPPDPHAPGRYTAIRELVQEFKGKKAVGVHLNDVFSLPRYLMGMTNLLMAVATDTELVRALVDLSVDMNLEMAKEVAALDVDFVHTGDDLAFNKGPLMSPQHFRDLFLPGFRRIVQGFKSLGLVMIKHTDGNIWSILDMMVDAGIDCLDPIDPQAGMDLAEVKRQYGDRIALKGNVDCAHLLSFGTPEQVVDKTKEVLAVGMPGGGFICSSSNSIHSSVKPENYLAMMNTIRECGHY